MKGRIELGRSRTLGTARGELRERLQSTDAAQLIEFSVELPLLVVLVVGASDFGVAWTLKDKLTNAAREGTRIAITYPNDLSQSPPASVTAAGNVVSSYLTNAGVTTCTMGTSASP